MQILFYDAADQMAYSNTTLQQQAVRGTEGTVIRIAHALKNYHQIYIAQYCRNKKDECLSDGVNYISLETAHGLSPDVVILLRCTKSLEKVGNEFPKAQHFFWMHNLPQRNLFLYREIFARYHYQIIAVSHFHARTIQKRLEGKWYQHIFHRASRFSLPPIQVIYNPIEDNLHPDATPYNSQQMIFTSSPYKGLQETLKRFASVLAHFPDYELLIASPNALDKTIRFPKHTRFLPPQPPQKLLQHIRESFCVFYPQTERLETFGLVYAEANAVGTPVLAHDFGAASEVLNDASQLVNGHKLSDILEKISAWRKHRPILQAKEAFRLSAVIQAWLRLIQGVTSPLST